MRLFLSVCTLILVYCEIGFVVFGGDTPYAIISEPNVDMFLGEIIEVTDDKITFNVSKAFFEAYEVGYIEVDKFKYPSYDNADGTPQAGDYCVIAAEYKDGGFRLWPDNNYPLTAKSDSLEPEELKLYNKDFGFTAEIEAFIKNGAYSYENRKSVLEQLGKTSTKDTEETAYTKPADIEQASTPQVQPDILETDEEQAVNPKKKPMNKLIRYSLLTFSSMLLSFCASRKLQGKPLWGKKSNL